jgi:exopolyphosphatase / guanosine-5'-triphosphate,3'-diphosphate pyrophosphatase
MRRCFSTVQDLSGAFPSKLSPHSSVYGAVDLGTNTCRMLIAKPDLYYLNPKGFETVDTFSRVIRFGQDLEETGALSQDAVRRALVALHECARRFSFYQVDHFRCVATAACREAKNAPEFLDQVKKETGLTVEIISPEEESLLAVTGCFDLVTHKIPYCIVFDIGGGSTEVALIEVLEAQKFKILDWMSLPYGILTLSDAVCSLEEKRDVTEQISFEMNEFAIRNNLPAHIRDKKVQMIGASGTVTTLAAIMLNLERYSRSRVHKTLLPAHEIHRVIQQLWQMKPSERLAHPCIGSQRVDFIMGGIAIFQGIYDILTVDPIVVADRGVREGILRHLMTQFPSGPEKIFPSAA